MDEGDDEEVDGLDACEMLDDYLEDRDYELIDSDGGRYAYEDVAGSLTGFAKVVLKLTDKHKIPVLQLCRLPRVFAKSLVTDMESDTHVFLLRLAEKLDLLETNEEAMKRDTYYES